MKVQAGRINSHNEWDPLREVIVGTAEGSTPVLTWAKPDPIPPGAMARAAAISGAAFPRWYLDEVEEDLSALCEQLQRCGAKVFRPEPFDLSRMFASPHWSSTSTNCYNTRDLNLVVGNSVIESPSYLQSRYYETQSLYPIWYEYFEKGFTWIAAPKPRLDYPVQLPYFLDENARVLTKEDVLHQQLAGGRLEKLHTLANKEILFEAANTIRMGRDLLFLVSASGNHLGARWLQSVLGADYRVHTTETIYRASHIDSTVCAFRPGLVLLNSSRVNEQNCPRLFDKWEKLYFGDVAPVSEEELAFQKDVRDPIAKQLSELGFQTNLGGLSSPWAGLNLLSINHDTVFVESRQTQLIRMLEQRKFTVVPIRMRHTYTQEGGLHCVTLDTVRESKLESYFD